MSTNVTGSLPGDLEDVEFEVEKEEWNTYYLKDGIRIKGRIIIMRITRDRNSPGGQYGIQSQNMFVTFAPNSLKGAPQTPQAQEMLQQTAMYPVDVQSSNEVWNIYKILKGGNRLKVKLVATEVLRVKDTFDQLGEPYYIVTSGVIVSPISSGISS